MQVRMLTFLLWYGRECVPGEESEIIDLPGDVARKYIATGQAEPIGESPVETAALFTKPFKGRKDGRILSTR